MTTSAPPADAATSADRGAGLAMRAAYYAFVLWIPIESLYVFKTNDKEGNISISRILGLVVFGLALIEWRRYFRRFPAAFWLVAWYVAVFALSQLWIPPFLDVKFHYSEMTLIQLAVLFLISLNLFEDAGFRGPLLGFFGWWTALVAGGMLLGVFGAKLEGDEGRSTLVGLDPNAAAALFALGAVCILGGFQSSASKRLGARLVAALLAVSTLITAILQTGSRGGLTVLIAGILGLIACGAKTTRGKRALILLCAGGLLGMLVLREFQHGTEAASRLSKTWNQGDTAGRTEIYDVAWPMFLERPLLGYGGANNYYTLGRRLHYANGDLYYRDTHNLYLALLTEVGLVGAVPFLAALLYALWIAWLHGRRTGDARLFALMCALITINSSLTAHQDKIFWILLAAAVACGSDRVEHNIHPAAIWPQSSIR
jgi:hypothetical protein